VPSRLARAYRTRRSTPPRTETAGEIDDQADQQNQAQPAAADDGTAEVKSAAPEQEQQHQEK